MKIQVKYKDIIVMEIQRVNKLYVNAINTENFKVALDEGMPLIEFINIKMLSKKMPDIVVNRIPNKLERDKELDIISDDEGINILEYIKKTNCSFVTDNIKIVLT